MLDAADEDLAARIVQRPKLYDEGALGRQRRFGLRAGTTRWLVIIPHDA